jgi:hypothetical protein
MPAKKPMMRENISSRPTDSSGRRASDADLGIGPGVAALRKAAAAKITAQEGTTSPSGGRPAVKMPAKIAAVKPVQKPVQVIRTTVNMKPTPAAKKR